MFQINEVEKIGRCVSVLISKRENRAHAGENQSKKFFLFIQIIFIKNLTIIKIICNFRLELLDISGRVDIQTVKPGYKTMIF